MKKGRPGRNTRTDQDDHKDYILSDGKIADGDYEAISIRCVQLLAVARNEALAQLEHIRELEARIDRMTQISDTLNQKVSDLENDLETVY